MSIQRDDAMRRLEHARHERDAAKSYVRSAEAILDGEPLDLPEPFRRHLERAAVHATRARMAGSAGAEAEAIQALISATEAETTWWRLALRKVQTWQE